MSDDPKMTKEELDVFYRRRRAKNWVFLVILGGLAALFFAITILKMS
ncbi:hypothetical protein [Thalassospira sp.]|nr:hypothetical protein [Thalassospira sp.]MDP2698775.1 hypothetical protein [Thalassospira sp.]